MAKQLYTLTDVEEKILVKAARQVAHRYWRYLVTVEDSLSECRAWLLEPKNSRRVKRWLESSPQQTTRIYFSLFAAAQRAAELMKAEKLGYSVDDVHWYSLATVEELLPLALNPDYDGSESQDKERDVDINEKVARHFSNHAESGDVLAMVMDVRQAALKIGSWQPEAIVAALGGSRPWVGRRQVMNNATALVKTGASYDG